MGKCKQVIIQSEKLDILLQDYTERTNLILSQKELANKLNMSKSTLSKINRGNRELTATEVAQIAEILDMTCDQVISGVAPKNKEYHMEYGLSNKALNWLNKSNKLKDNHLVNMLNLLFKDDGTIELLLESMYYYSIISNRDIRFKNIDGTTDLTCNLSNQKAMYWASVSENVEEVFKNITTHYAPEVDEETQKQYIKTMKKLTEYYNKVYKQNEEEYLHDIEEN